MSTTLALPVRTRATWIRLAVACPACPALGGCPADQGCLECPVVLAAWAAKASSAVRLVVCQAEENRVLSAAKRRFSIQPSPIQSTIRRNICGGGFARSFMRCSKVSLAVTTLSNGRLVGQLRQLRRIRPGPPRRQ